MSPELRQHLEGCPSCAQAVLLAMDFEGEFREPRRGASLPGPIGARVEVLRKERLAARTKAALESLAAKGKQGREWVNRTLERALSGGLPAAAPAAPDDLTKAKDEKPRKKTDQGHDPKGGGEENP
ncbi:MAG: hypothetical protein AB1814_19395 [Thermodesulfobacteriota bacterium]